MLTNHCSTRYADGNAEQKKRKSAAHSKQIYLIENVVNPKPPETVHNYLST
jgi:hypothetical protein